jgi:hypothetical protein
MRCQRAPAGSALTLSTYYQDAASAHRELDIEFSPSLGFTASAAGHFTVQPYQRAGNTHEFAITSPWSGVHQFEWRPDRVVFQSRSTSWTFNAPNVPTPDVSVVRVNLWLFDGRAPSNGRDAELLISRFEFRP